MTDTAITQEEIHALIELSDLYRAEAKRSADAGAFLAACAMIGSALETMLYTAILMSKHVLEPAGDWPQDRRHPSEWSLGLLVGTAIRAGWFDGFPELGEAVDATNTFRVALIHPAAYVRDGAEPPNNMAYRACFAVLMGADQRIGDVVAALPPP